MPLPPLGKSLLMSVGVLSVGLGAAGIFLPLLPTTPFLLLAAACFMRSSERLYQWLLGHKWFGSYIRNYREHRAIPLRSKIVVLVMLWVSLGSTTLIVLETALPRAVLLVVGLAVTVYMLRLRTLTPGMRSETAIQKPSAEDENSP